MERTPGRATDHVAIARRPADIDRYDRLVVRCTNNGRDLGITLGNEGMLIADPAYGRDYRDEEATARRAQRGGSSAFRGSSLGPAYWRGPQPREASRSPLRRCRSVARMGADWVSTTACARSSRSTTCCRLPGAKAS